MEIHEMLMPDPTRIPDEAPGYEPLPATITWYRTLPGQFRSYFDSFGKGVKTNPPVLDPPPPVTGSERANFENYAVTALSLRQAMTELHDSGKKLAPLAHGAAETSEAGQKGINGAIDMINAAAPTVPKPGIKEDQHIYEYVDGAVKAAIGVLDQARAAHEKLRKGVDGEADKVKELEDRIKKLELEKAALQKRLADPVDVGQPPSTPPSGMDPPYVDPNTFPPGLDNLGNDGTGLDNTPPTGLDNSGANGRLPGGLDNIGNTPGTTPVTPAVQPASATSPMGSGMDMLGSMLPMMMQQAMMRNMADQDLNNRRAELDPSRFEDELAPVTPQPVTPPVTAQTAVAPQASTAPATQHGPQQTNTNPVQPAVPPGRTPGADGSVVYTFPDGRTQKVSATVAQALDAAFGNASGTDAQAAYAKTSAKWSDKKQIGERVDPYQLMTGDVATWDNRAAILVVFGSDEGGTLEAVVNGKLKPFVAEMSDSAGEFGQFAGFVHPKGIELTAPVDGATHPATPGMTDQSVNAAVPAVAAPVV